MTRVKEMRNITDHPVTLETEKGSITLQPGQSVKDIRLEESALRDRTDEIRARIVLND